MKNLLKLAGKKIIILILAVIIGVFLWNIKDRLKKPERVGYDYQNCDSFYGGLPDYGLKKRGNILINHIQCVEDKP
ncbi:MAG: hypothetical protein IJO74_02420 [Clostridia bacterium]|nr:hypothetical protein [Clostridia bacterium]